MKLTTDIEDAVDAIRDSIYEEIKDMTPAEETAYFHAVAEKARKRNICVVQSVVDMAARHSGKTPAVTVTR